MKQTILIGLILGSTGVGLLSGCVERRVYVQGPPVAVQPGDVVVSSPPPAPQQEVIVTSPGPGYVWAPGYWAWHGRWVWVGGRWVVRPRMYTAWVPGHWAHRPHGYVWVGGYWR